MFKNPEFIRNTWTELTAKKLAAMPLLLITVYLLAYILDEALPFSFLPYICVFFYCVFTYVWSTRLAAETVIREINANTWSFQVMTSMSPVKMAVGKLFGSTIYIWYGNFICFALYLLSYHLHRERLPEVPLPELLTNVLIFVLFGLSAQILPLLLSLHSIRWRHFFEKFDVTFFQFMGIAMIIPLYKVFNGSGEGIVWYGAHYTAKEAAVVFLSVFIVWGFIAIVNQIKTEFGQEPYPVSWFLFTLSLVAVLFGFNDYGSDNPLVRYVGTLSAFFAVLAVTYLTLCGESNMALRPNMVSKYYHGKQYKRLFMIMPRSLVTIPVIGTGLKRGIRQPGTGTGNQRRLHGLGDDSVYAAGLLLYLPVVAFCPGQRKGNDGGSGSDRTFHLHHRSGFALPFRLAHFLPVLYALFPRKQLSHLQRKRFSDGYPAGAGICLYAGSSDFGYQKKIPRTPGLSSRQKNPRFRRGFFIAKISYCF